MLSQCSPKTNTGTQAAKAANDLHDTHEAKAANDLHDTHESKASGRMNHNENTKKARNPRNETLFIVAVLL
jgi:hypothetical protein